VDNNGIAAAVEGVLRDHIGMHGSFFVRLQLGILFGFAG